MKPNLYKREETYWIDVTVNGQRIRQSLKTKDWKEAQHRGKELVKDAICQKLAPAFQEFAKLSLPLASERYLDSRKIEISNGTWKKEKQLFVQLLKFFGNKKVQYITVEDVLSYREWRAKNGAGTAIINMEVGVLSRVLKRAKRWQLFESDVRPLKGKHSIGRAMKPEEKSELLRIAAVRPEWQVTKCAAIIALNTTMRGCELKSLKWEDVNLIEKMITVRKSKTDAGLRAIPINAAAMAAFMELFHRAEKFKGTEPQHYVFAACEHGDIDPTIPMASWRTSWRALTRAISCPKCGLLQNPDEQCNNAECKANLKGVKSVTAGLRFHDLRHHAITELAESQTSEQTILSIAGHVSRRMLEHYSHVRIEAKRNALDALAPSAKENGTNCGTSQDSEQGAPEDRVASC